MNVIPASLTSLAWGAVALLALGCGGTEPRGEGIECSEDEQCEEGLACIEGACAKEEDGPVDFEGTWDSTSVTESTSSCEQEGPEVSADDTPRVEIKSNGVSSFPFSIALCPSSGCDGEAFHSLARDGDTKLEGQERVAAGDVEACTLERIERTVASKDADHIVVEERVYRFSGAVAEGCSESAVEARADDLECARYQRREAEK